MRINSLIGSLPGYWLLFEAIHLSLLRSKVPDWIGLYSNAKFCAIILLLFSSWFAFRYFAVWFSDFVNRLSINKIFFSSTPLQLFLICYLFFKLLLIKVPLAVGEDLTLQILSARQWIEGDSSMPNIIVSPSLQDLAKNEANWILRPPGASWIPLPVMLLGLPVGYSIQLMLSVFSIATGIGWLHLAKKLKINKYGLFILSLWLSIYCVINSNKLSTASVITSATFPWLIIWALNIANQWIKNGHTKEGFGLHSVFFLIIGIHAFIKLSSLLTLASVAILPFIIFFLKSHKLSKLNFARFATSILLFFSPYFIVSAINVKLTGISSDELYSKQDYNAQHYLWGKHFSESTRGFMLAASFAASTGYSSPCQQFIHQLRDFLLQFNSYRKCLDDYGINSRIFGCIIISIPLTLLIFYLLIKHREIFPVQSLILYITLLTIPFLGLGILSYHHGYNYLIYHAYTKEFSIIFIFIGLHLLTITRQISKIKFLRKFFIGVLVAIPLVSSTNSYYSQFSNSLNLDKPSPYEYKQGFGHTKFSNSLDLITNDTNSSLDLCFFFCAGNYGDNALRTPMRSISMHFSNSKGRIKGFPNLRTTQPLNLYFLIDPILSNDKYFIESVLSKVPDNSVISRIDALTLKVEMKPMKS